MHMPHFCFKSESSQTKLQADTTLMSPILDRSHTAEVKIIFIDTLQDYTKAMGVFVASILLAW